MGILQLWFFPPFSLCHSLQSTIQIYTYWCSWYLLISPLLSFISCRFSFTLRWIRIHEMKVISLQSPNLVWFRVIPPRSVLLRFFSLGRDLFLILSCVISHLSRVILREIMGISYIPFVTLTTLYPFIVVQLCFSNIFF